jgi:hypothetical protein
LEFLGTKYYQLEINGQVCFLQKMLNDRWDNTLRRIIIEDVVLLPVIYVYAESELKDLYIKKESENDPKFIYTESETGVDADDFLIKIPSAITFDELEIRALLYKVIII